VKRAFRFIPTLSSVCCFTDMANKLSLSSFLQRVHAVDQFTNYCECLYVSEPNKSTFTGQMFFFSATDLNGKVLHGDFL